MKLEVVLLTVASVIALASGCLFQSSSAVDRDRDDGEAGQAGDDDGPGGTGGGVAAAGRGGNGGTIGEAGMPGAGGTSGADPNGGTSGWDTSTEEGGTTGEGGTGTSGEGGKADAGSTNGDSGAGGSGGSAGSVGIAGGGTAGAPATITKGGFRVTWSLRRQNGAATLTCGEAAGASVSVLSTLTSNPSVFQEDLFDCDADTGTVVRDLGSYRFSITLLNAGDQAIGTAPVQDVTLAASPCDSVEGTTCVKNATAEIVVDGS